MSIRELTRNGSMFANYDYINIEDKKSNEYKGVFISSKYADLVKEFLEKEIAKQKKKKLDDIMQFAGIMDGDTNNLSIQEIKSHKEDK
ncbi:MAG: Unknown protein [uncultured Sulfurovum sp.]|uniref:Uncharacterized protein n=1 Tax=uncultured Sulfurovum sp. TaxID=269237 RepID=A0A6S6TTK9_9BACT|nr:MAG: Unknown protein [uncultured Sulfurovum sp.]